MKPRSLGFRKEAKRKGRRGRGGGEAGHKGQKTKLWHDANVVSSSATATATTTRTGSRSRCLSSIRDFLTASGPGGISQALGDVTATVVAGESSGGFHRLSAELKLTSPPDDNAAFAYDHINPAADTRIGRYYERGSGSSAAAGGPASSPFYRHQHGGSDASACERGRLDSEGAQQGSSGYYEPLGSGPVRWAAQLGADCSNDNSSGGGREGGASDAAAGTGFAVSLADPSPAAAAVATTTTTTSVRRRSLSSAAASRDQAKGPLL